jgi:predicted GTPase
MKDSIHGLRENITQFQQLLEQGSFLSFSPGETQLLMEDGRRLLARLEEVAETFLTVGLLGGTGVGKSTIMNALAGSEIASTSHRRPHTDQVLIYRHGSAVLPAALHKTEVPWREITHPADSIRQILLCDLPDFDSLEGEHQERVIGFLDHLDVLVWVTSPEKYADGRFYSFLHRVPKARRNFYFVLNKVDLIFQERALEAGFDQLAGVTGRFQQHLVDQGIPHPLIYAVSAHDAMGSAAGSPWNQFASFRHQIFQHRDTKEIMAIKTANLDVEVHQFMLVLEKEVHNLLALREALRDFIVELDEGRPEWVRSGADAMGIWLETHFNKQAFLLMDHPAPLVGPGYIFAEMIREWRKWSGGGAPTILSGLSEGKGPLFTLKRHLTRLEDRMAHRLLRRGLPSTFSPCPEGIFKAEAEWDAFCDRLHRFVEMRLGSRRIPGLIGFRCLQYGAYLVLLAVFLVAIGGEDAWAGLLRHPSWGSFGTLVSSVVGALFGPAGLAGLCSYVLLNTLLGFRFYVRYKKTLQQRAQKFIESLKLESGEIWEEELRSIRDRIEKCGGEIESQVSIIEGLRKPQEEKA